MWAISKYATIGSNDRRGFTIVELLIVIVVIGILAAITIVAYQGVQKRAFETKIESDRATLVKAITIARNTQQSTLREITGNSHTAAGCTAKDAGTDLATLSKTSDSCWTSYLDALDKISAASGVDVTKITDPWGRPFYIDENEGESGGCNGDSLNVFANPFNKTHRYLGEPSYKVPLSGYSGCTVSAAPSGIKSDTTLAVGIKHYA